MDILEPETPDHTLKDVPNLCFEMILVVMSPAKKSGHELRQLRSYQALRERMNRQFDKAKGRLDNFTVRRGEENKECGEKIVKHVRGDCVCYREVHLSMDLLFCADRGGYL